MRQLKITQQITNRETASLDKYLTEIGRESLISADEEVELAKRIKTGDLVLMCAVGGGFTGGAHLLRWCGQDTFK